jgi:hypothetical protein
MLFSNDPKKVRQAIGMIAKEYKHAQAFEKFQRELGAAGAGAGDDVANMRSGQPQPIMPE